MTIEQFSRSRLLAAAAFLCAVVAFSLLMTTAVPVRMPRLPEADAARHLSYLAISALAVILVSGATAAVALRTSWTGAGQAMLLLFGVLTALQLAHFGEHIIQVVQLVLTHGVLKRSQGLLGGIFDNETVHLTWNAVVWLATCLLAVRYRRNAWLWISLGVASFHTIEHLYLYWIYTTDPLYYARGGINGVFGLGGMVGSPLTRPYLHWLYNSIEVSTLVIAFIDQFRNDFRPARTAALQPA